MNRNVDSFLQIVHALEGTSSEDGMIGTLAEDLLDVIEQGEGEELVRNLRNERKRDMKERARLQREAAMKALMGSTSPQLLQPDVESKEDVHNGDEDEYNCIVCKEGYIDQPDLILGVYCEVTKKRHPHRICFAGGSHPQQEHFLISLFSPVHFACHEAARKADSNLRVPKREWDGAALRNSLTPCNIIFPVYHPNLAREVYLNSVNVYWEKRAVLARSRLSRCHVLLGDIEYLLLYEIASRFRCRESNRDQEYSSPLMSCIQMLCGLVQMGRAMLNDSDVGSLESNRAYRETLGRLMGQSSAQASAEAATDEDVAFLAIASLVFGTVLEWTSVIKPRFETSLAALRNADRLPMKSEEAEASLIEIIELIHDASDKCGDQYEDILVLISAVCSEAHV